MEYELKPLEIILNSLLLLFSVPIELILTIIFQKLNFNKNVQNVINFMKFVFV